MPQSWVLHTFECISVPIFRTVASAVASQPELLPGLIDQEQQHQAHPCATLLQHLHHTSLGAFAILELRDHI
jgi:hypothetical protein